MELRLDVVPNYNTARRLSWDELNKIRRPLQRDLWHWDMNAIQKECHIKPFRSELRNQDVPCAPFLGNVGQH